MKCKTKIMLSILAVLLVLTPLIYACDDDDEKDSPAAEKDVKLTLGVISDITGPAAQAMTIIDTAIADLVRYYNEEDLIPGVELEVITYDGQYDPANDIPGYEWLRERGADIIVTGLPPTPVTLKSRLDKDHVVLFALTASREMVDPPGYVFSMNCLSRSFVKTLLEWIAENDWDYQTQGPARIGAAGWMGPMMDALQAGMKEYAQAHPDRFEWVGGFQTAYSMTWENEVDQLKDCDYVLPPITGIGTVGFINEYNEAGGKATFIGLDGHNAYYGLVLSGCGWDSVDGFLTTSPNRWWTEDAEMPNLINDVLDRYHTPSEAEKMKMGGSSYLGAFTHLYEALQIVAETVEEVGPENFTSEALYETATSFSMEIDGRVQWNFTETKRTAPNYLAILEWDAAEQDLVRVEPDWLPILY